MRGAVAITATTTLTTCGILPPFLPPLSAIAAFARVAAIRSTLVTLLRSRHRRGIRSAPAVHTDALDGETLRFETFTKHAHMRLKQQSCLRGCSSEIGNNCALRDL